jgi:4-hydroxy-3-methylbut-2-enyl diphosphate reductase
MITIETDENSGFCFGVVNAIESAERELARHGELFCIGDLVHNGLEVERLRHLGLQTLDRDMLPTLHDVTILLRAHGEPPSTYETARLNNLTVVDATCPVVLKLQRRIHECYEAIKCSDTQLVIYGKRGHAEVNGLVGQTEGRAIVVEGGESLEQLDFSRDIILFSQTTMPLDGFGATVALISSRIAADVSFRYYDTICRQVANRLPKIKEFAANHDVVYFVAGANSSNGRMLFEECQKSNPDVIFISDSKDITEPLPPQTRSVGVCGATSTPKWLMEEVATKIKVLNNII